MSGHCARTKDKGKVYHTLQYRCVVYNSKDRREAKGEPCPIKRIPAKIADERAWAWLSGLMLDAEKLSRGLQCHLERRESELQPKRERLTLIEDLIVKAERKIKRLAAEIANAEDETVLDALRGELKAASKQKESLVVECGLLEAEVAQRVISPEQLETVGRLAAQIRARLSPEPSFEQKMTLLDLLDVRGTVRRADDGLYLDCTCALSLDPIPLPIDSPHVTQHTGDEMVAIFGFRDALIRGRHVSTCASAYVGVAHVHTHVLTY
jgi:hypothetical protein